jgi:two-component system response regulator FixJ
MAGEALVHIIDDDAALRESLTFLLASVRMKAATYASAVAFLECLPSVTTGCIVTDVRMPEMSGIDLLRQLQARGVTMPVIVMTAHSDVPMAVTAMRLGAADFLEKPFDQEVLIAAIRATLARQNIIEENHARGAQVRDRLATLSARERQVLDGLVAGNPNKTIAYDLGISPRTVEVYRANVMTKMDASSLSDLVRMALTAGIFEER